MEAVAVARAVVEEDYNPYLAASVEASLAADYTALA
jgi:hypothetical protein